jgi:hypothetical protein
VCSRSHKSDLLHKRHMIVFLRFLRFLCFCLPLLLFDQQHRFGIKRQGQLRDIGIIVILQKRELHPAFFIGHLHDDRYGGG